MKQPKELMEMCGECASGRVVLHMSGRGRWAAHVFVAQEEGGGDGEAAAGLMVGGIPAMIRSDEHA